VTYEPLAFEDAFELLGPALPKQGVVLVGGQAVNLWLSVFRGREPSLDDVAAVTSDDVDFYGFREAALSMAEHIRGAEFQAPTIDDATPNSALILFNDKGGLQRRIDFLWSVQGLKDRRIRKTAIDVELRDREGNPTGVILPVLHPVLCVASRFHNTSTWAKYQAPRAIRQARAAIGCAKGFIREACDAGEVREAHHWIKVLGALAATRVGKDVHARFGLDAFDAIPEDERLGADCLTKNIPRLKRRAGR
jgi:hypothetical protein